MPLRLLKRTSKQYNVVSKTTFVISVDLLDNGTMECTLDADSSGKDCLLNISQRLGLHQPEFFGLRYISRGVPPRQRWVELERPLKKQLEKHAQDSQLSLGVMFYVSDVNLLKDEMARYHYFLQLKSDVIDGKLNCNIDQAISLAAYSLQAEFGDYDPERHTTEYLRDFAILPKELTNEEKYADSVNLDALHEAVARQYGSLVGFPPPLAEIYYIMVAQQLDGYGQEAYPAKDDAGNDILICVSLNGLVIRRRDWTHVAVFRWSDIKSIIGHKRLFVVEKAQSQRTMQFHFTDPEVAKYVRKMCILQSTFYKQNIQGGGGDSSNSNLSSSSSSNNMLMSEGNHGHHGHFTSHAEGPSPSSTSTLTFGGGGGSNSGIMGMRSTPDLIAPISSMTMPMSLTNLPGRLNSLNSMGGGSQYSLNNNCNNLSNSGFSLHLLQHGPTSATGTMGQQQQQQQYLHSIQQQQQQQQQMSMTQHGHSLGHGLNVNGALSPSADDLQSLQNLLPSYRQAPDYDTAVQLKYGHGVTVGGGSSQIYYEGGNSGSQSDEEPIYQNEIVSQMHSIELRDSGTGTTGASPATSSIPSNLNGSIRSRSNLNTNASMPASNPVLAPTPNPNPTITTTITVTGEPLSQIQSQKLNTSSTNLNQNHTHGQQTDSQGQDQADDPHMYIYKPPPPYPGQVQGQSAALLSQQTQVQLQQQQQQSLDGSNLNGKIGRSSDNVTFVDLSSSGVVVGTVTPVVAAGMRAPQNKITVTTGSGTIIQNQEIIEIRGNAIAAPQVSPLPSSSSTDTHGHGSKKHGTNFKSGSARSSNASITNNNNLSATTTTSVAENSSPGNTKRSTSCSVTSSTGSGSGINTVLVSSVSSVSAKTKVSVNNKPSTSTTSLPTATVSTSPSPSTNGGASATVTGVTASSSSLPAAPAKYSSNTSKSSSSGSSHHHKKEHSSQKHGHGHQSKDGKLYGKSIDDNILQEYQGIRKAKNAPNFATALKRENSKRNRFPNILPYEDNSIRLNPSRHNPTGYINASPVSAHISGRDWKYLVGQIPLAGNGPAVWQMIWETEAKIIASLERDSTAPFYPPLDNYAPMVFNDFQLSENKERSNNGTTIAREFILTYLPKKKQRKVWILPYEEEWKDDVPIHTEHFLCFLEEVNSIQRKVSDPSTPLVVLCGTGAGRSGVLILSDLLLHAADSGHKLRCDNLLGELRTQRMMLVSSAPQYAFVLHTLAKYLAQSRLI